MSTEVTVALLAAVTSLVVAVVSVWRTGVNEKKVVDLQLKAKDAELAMTAKAELDRYREPLLLAALDLASRLDNIRNKGYLDKYLSDGERRSQIARISTYYRFARYWCVVENLYAGVALVRFEQDPDTKAVAGMLRKLGKAFATDDYGRDFMMWRDEQRAVAELTRGSAAVPDVIGFARFFENYEDDFAPWFHAFERDLSPSTARASERFRTLQHDLARLVDQLDSSHTYRKQCKKLLKASASEPPATV